MGGQKHVEGGPLNVDLKQDVKKEPILLDQDPPRQDKEVNVVGVNGGGGQENLLKRELGQFPLEEEKPILQGLGGQVEGVVGVVDGHDKEEIKENVRVEVQQDVRGEKVEDEGDEARKVRELKAMTETS